MPTYRITHPGTGKTLSITGDTWPTEQQLNQIFSETSGAPVGEAPPMMPSHTPGQVTYHEPEWQSWTRKGLIGAGAGIGGVVATPETLGVGTIPGAMLGGSAGKYLGDILLGPEVRIEPETKVEPTFAQAAARGGREIFTKPEKTLREAEGLLTFPATAAETVKGIATAPTRRETLERTKQAATGLVAPLMPWTEAGREAWQESPFTSMAMAAGALKGGVKVGKTLKNAPGQVYNLAAKTIHGGVDIRGPAKERLENFAQKQFDRLASKGESGKKVLDDIFTGNLYKLRRVRRKQLGLGREDQVAYENKIKTGIDENLQQAMEGRRKQDNGILADETVEAHKTYQNIWKEIEGLFDRIGGARIDVTPVVNRLAEIEARLRRTGNETAANAVAKRREFYEENRMMPARQVQENIAEANRKVDFNRLAQEQQPIVEARWQEAVELNPLLDAAINELPDSPNVRTLKERYGAAKEYHDLLAEAMLKDIQQLSSRQGIVGLERTALVGGVGGVMFGNVPAIATSMSLELAALLKERGQNPNVQMQRMIRTRKSTGAPPRQVYPEKGPLIGPPRPRTEIDPQTGAPYRVDQPRVGGVAPRELLSMPEAPRMARDPQTGALMEVGKPVSVASPKSLTVRIGTKNTPLAVIEREAKAFAASAEKSGKPINLNTFAKKFGLTIDEAAEIMNRVAPIIEPRAQGGPVEAGKPYLVGENGPEVIVPGTDGMVIPNEQVMLPGFVPKNLSAPQPERRKVYGNTPPNYLQMLAAAKGMYDKGLLGLLEEYSPMFRGKPTPEAIRNAMTANGPVDPNDPALERLAMEVASSATPMGMAGITAFHGSPVSSLKELDLAYRGTGIGGLRVGDPKISRYSDAVAHGIYSSELERVAEGARRRAQRPGWITDQSGRVVEENELATIAERLKIPESRFKNALARVRKHGDIDSAVGEIDETLADKNFFGLFPDAAKDLHPEKSFFAELKSHGYAGKKNPDPGAVYTTELLPSPEDYLLPDTFLSHQSKNIRDALREIHKKFNPYGVPFDKQKAKTLYREIASSLGSEKAASEYLANRGIAGMRVPNKYKGQKFYDFVTFDPKKEMIITHENGQRIPGAVEEAYAKMRDPKSKKILEERYPELKQKTERPYIPEGYRTRSHFVKNLTEPLSIEYGFLRPAVKADGKLFTASANETHYEAAMKAQNTLKKTVSDEATGRGWATPDGKFLTPKEAISWLKQNDRQTYRNLEWPSSGLESTDYMEAIGKWDTR